MRRTISLDGPWERRDFIGEAWRWSDALRREESGAEEGPPAQASVSGGWRQARVPGSAIDDAWRAGEIPNPYLDRNSLLAEWIPQRTWLYRRRIAVPDGATARASLRFEGLDPGGTVHLDGEEIGRHHSTYLPLELDLTGRLEPRREHDLVVVLEPAPDMPPQVGSTEAARHHRSRMGYGWDFCARMVHTGIWRSVSLELYRARIGPARLSVALRQDRAAAGVTVDVPVDGDADGASMSAVVRGPDGARLAAVEAGIGAAVTRIALEVSDPELWWPNGLGAPALHTIELTLRSGGEVLDARTMRFGIRSISAQPVVGAAVDALPYALFVNGRPTWIRGWNWVPLDAAYGVPRPDRLAHLVELARRANVNLLRVWGGGLIESDAFYDACDAAGIMIWQEFSQSSSGVSNAPADDPEFVALMRRDAEGIVPLRANHPSLAIWCGGNELAGPDRPLDDDHPVLAALHDVVARLDPGRIWLPTSPSGPRFDNSLAAIADDPASLHDVHGPWEHQGLTEQHTLADATTNLLHGEFGVEGMTNVEALRATVTEPNRRPLDRTNPVMAHRGAWWNNEPFVQRAFGGGLDLDALARASQHLQADGLRTLVEGDRRRWPRNAGAIPWQLNESFPNAWCTAAVDYFGVPKAAYRAVAEAFDSVAVGLSFASQALCGADHLEVRPWVANDGTDALEGPLQIALHDGAGRRLGEASVPLAVPPGTVAQAAAPTFDLPPMTDPTGDLLVLDGTFGVATTRRILSRTDDLAPMRRLPATTLDASVTAESDERWLVRLAAAGVAAALESRVDDARPVGWPERRGYAYVAPNVVTLLPGERREIGIEWRDVPPGERRLRLSAWNVAERVLSLA